MKALPGLVGLLLLLLVGAPVAQAGHLWPYCTNGTAISGPHSFDARLCWNGGPVVASATVELEDPETGLPLPKMIFAAKESFDAVVLEGCLETLVGYKLESTLAPGLILHVRGDHARNFCTGEPILHLTGHYLGVFQVEFDGVE